MTASPTHNSVNPVHEIPLITLTPEVKDRHPLWKDKYCTISTRLLRADKVQDRNIQLRIKEIHLNVCPQKKLIKLGNHHYCLFHLPKETLTTAEIDQVISDDSDIKADLSAGGPPKPELTSSKEDVYHQLIRNRFNDECRAVLPEAPNLDLRYVIFPRYFDTKIFLDDPGKRTISREADFSSAVFYSKADFFRFNFSEGGNFKEVLFRGNASFREVHFKKVVEFGGAKFYGNAVFCKAKFSNTLKGPSTAVLESLIKKRKMESESFSTIDFSNVEFKAGADFSDVQFIAENVFFEKAKFRHAADFQRTFFRVNDIEINHETAVKGCNEAKTKLKKAKKRFVKAGKLIKIALEEVNKAYQAKDREKAVFEAAKKLQDEAKEGMSAKKERQTARAEFLTATKNLNEAADELNKALKADPDFKRKRVAVSFEDADFYDGARFTGKDVKGTSWNKAYVCFESAYFKDPTKVGFASVRLNPSGFFRTDPKKIEFTSVRWENLEYFDSNRPKKRFLRWDQWFSANMRSELWLYHSKKSPSLNYRDKRFWPRKAYELSWLTSAYNFKNNFQELKERKADLDKKIAEEKKFKKELNDMFRWGYEELTQTSRRLAISSQNDNHYNDASDFRYMSFESSLVANKTFRNLIPRLYKYSSGYGEKMIPSLIFLLGVVFIAPLIYYKHKGYFSTVPDIAGTRRSVEQLLWFSLQMMTLQKPVLIPTDTISRILSVLQGVLGPAQLALLFFAVRRRVMN